jgi:hypothetical protein
VSTGYVSTLLGPLIVTGFGTGLVIAPSMNVATFRVPPDDAGVATAQTQQQIGLPIGTALLNTLAVSATAHYLAAGATSSLATRTTAPALSGRSSLAALNVALVHGYTTAFWWAAAIFVVGAIACGALLHNGRLVGEA